MPFGLWCGGRPSVDRNSRSGYEKRDSIQRFFYFRDKAIWVLILESGKASTKVVVIETTLETRATFSAKLVETLLVASNPAFGTLSSGSIFQPCYPVVVIAIETGFLILRVSAPVDAFLVVVRATSLFGWLGRCLGG